MVGLEATQVAVAVARVMRRKRQRPDRVVGARGSTEALRHTEGKGVVRNSLRPELTHTLRSI